jgi:hypothetical protein
VIRIGVWLCSKFLERALSKLFELSYLVEEFRPNVLMKRVENKKSILKWSIGFL